MPNLQLATFNLPPVKIRPGSLAEFRAAKRAEVLVRAVTQGKAHPHDVCWLELALRDGWPPPHAQQEPDGAHKPPGSFAETKSCPRPPALGQILMEFSQNQTTSPGRLHR